MKCTSFKAAVISCLQFAWTKSKKKKINIQKQARNTQLRMCRQANLPSLSLSLSKVRHTKIYIYLMHDDKHQNLAPNTREYTHEVAKSNGQVCKTRRKSILNKRFIGFSNVRLPKEHHEWRTRPFSAAVLKLKQK